MRSGANTWTTKAAIPTSRSGAFACVVNGKGYVGTGAISGGYTTTLREYDPVANTWATKASLRATIDRGRNGAVAFSIGDKGYIGTGYNGTSYLNDFWEYDPATNAWTQRANFGGTARWGSEGFNIGSKGYIGTGYDGAYQKDFWEYDPAANSWLQKADFVGTARADAIGFSIGSKGYIGTVVVTGLSERFLGI
ncbi:MAG: hypothetical protein IPH78_12235 [Bacteroidetes bacterium]|nr:hypothetical protein [Bacteroidota bacterium]